MTQTIIVKNSSTPGKEPPSLAPGELGVNLADQKLYTADQEGHVFELGAPGDPGVTKLVAGSNITLSPSTGLGEVTINAVGGSSVGTLQQVTDAGNTTTNDIETGDIQCNDLSADGVAAFVGPVSIGDVVTPGGTTQGQLFVNSADGEDSSTVALNVAYGANQVFSVDYTGAILGDGSALTGVIHSGDDISLLNNNVGYLASGDNVSLLNNDAGYLASGDNVSLLNNDAGYLASGDDISLLTNNAGYLTDAPSDGQEYCRKNSSWSVITGGGGGGSTNLGNTPTTTQVTITSSTGSDTVVAAASGSQAGVMTTAQVNTLSSASSNASQALSDASAAQSTASQASSTASQAQSTANSASTTASDAQSRAIAAQNTADACVQKSGDTMTGRLTFGSGADLFAQSTLTLYGSNSANSIVLDGSGATVSNTSSGYAAGIRYAQSNAWIGWKYIASQGAEFIYNNTPWFTVQAQYSDARLKKDVTPLEPEGGAIELVNELNPVQYRWKDAEEPWYCQRQLAIDPEGTYKWGFIAQEVGQTIPASFLLADVTEDRPDPIADYDLRAVVALLTKAVQDLSAEVAALKSAADS